MNQLTQSLQTILTTPSPVALWHLRGDLLQSGVPLTSPVWQVVDQFYTFLNAISAQTKAHEFTKLATMLDIGAVGGVAIQSLLEANISANDLWKKLVAGGVGETLMVLASRQYVKGAKVELEAAFDATAWTLYQQLWQLSSQLQPQQDPAERRQLLDGLLAPAHAENVDDVVKIVLIGRLYQLLLLVYLKLGIGDQGLGIGQDDAV